MADKTGIAYLPRILGHLLLEHRAMRALLREDESDLRAAVLRLTNSPKVRADVQRELNELGACLQSAPLDEHAIALLSGVLERAIVLQGVRPL